jgi:uncharacterized protein (TIGR02145 family)
MSETCPVCKTECSDGAIVCSICGFADELGINRTWTIKEDASNWLETVVKPYRVRWEAENAIKRAEAEVRAKEAEIAELKRQVTEQASVAVPPAYEDTQPKKMSTVTKVVLSIICIGILLLGYGIFIGNNKSLAPKVVHTNKTVQEQQSEQKAAVETDVTTVKNTFTDSRDSKIYKTVKIGSQIWMAENLNYNASGSKCYDNTPANCNKYGRLYNWNTAIKACPSGWHLPGKAEWDEAVGGYSIAGTKLKAKSGFSALPGGLGFSIGSFSNVGNRGIWWSSSEIDSDNAYYWYIYYYDEYVGSGNDVKRGLHSVRCVKD